jgi:aminoglycoside phosphotransferase (APT) family kinase protein
MSGPLAGPTSAERAIADALVALGLADPGESPRIEPLSGGVSSEIWRITTRRGDICVKRALPRLKVAAVWEAPLERSHHEAEWLRVAAAILPQSVPELLGEDEANRLVAMRYLPASSHRLWKTMLREGDADPSIAAMVGTTIATIHAVTAGDRSIAGRFATGDAFHALRLEPYLEATARVHPDVAGRLMELSRITGETRLALVHGDVSPKNILVGPHGPVLLDAECAWYGDPAFDLAFVLNHLLLKCLWTPQAADAFVAAFGALTASYGDKVDWEPLDALEQRVAGLLPGLMLARIDGKSPVEYVTDEETRNRVRRFAIPLLREPVAHPTLIAHRWLKEGP